MYAAAPRNTIGTKLAVRVDGARGTPLLRTMPTRWHLKPGQKSTKQLLAQYGDLPPAPRFADDALVAVRDGLAKWNCDNA